MQARPIVRPVAVEDVTGEQEQIHLHLLIERELYEIRERAAGRQLQL